MNLNEVHDLLDELDRDTIDVTIVPPYEEPGADTDCDSDASDDEVTCNPDHLPRRILSTDVIISSPKKVTEDIDEDPLQEATHSSTSQQESCEVSLHCRSKTDPGVSHPESTTPQRRVSSRQKAQEICVSPQQDSFLQQGKISNISRKRACTTKNSQKKKKTNYNWHQNKIRVETKVPDFVQPPDADLNQLKQTIKNPVDCINLFLTNEWIGEICEQSTLYAQQRSLPCNSITPENVRTFLSILILSGYNKLPSRRLYWSESPDVFNNLVSDSMRRNTFEQIMRCLHFADNMKMTDDRFYKVRSLFMHINKVCKPKYQQEFYSVDEIMVPYFGKHGDKQFIRGKPIRFGFKIWAICTSDGSLLHAEPYCGSHTNIPDVGLGQGPNVVMSLADKINLQAGQHIVFDNLFTSLALLENLAEQGIGGTGTLREDRLHGAPLTVKKEMEKQKRGYMQEAFTGCVSVVKWKDNKVVSVASNKLRSFPKQNAKRWSKTEKKHIDVDMPNSVMVYNQHMGGVDVFDQQVSAYRIRIRSKKWWWSLFAWTVNAQITNAWMLFRKLGNSITLLEFIRHGVIAIMKEYGTPRMAPGPRRLATGLASSTVRYNGQQHWIKKGDQPNSRCRECSRRTVFLCKMCAVPLHPECMEKYHTFTE